MFTGLVTTREAARRLGISDRRIRQLLAEGRIKAIQIGGRWLIEESDCYYEKRPRGGYKPRKETKEEVKEDETGRSSPEIKSK